MERLEVREREFMLLQFIEDWKITIQWGIFSPKKKLAPWLSAGAASMPALWAFREVRDPVRFRGHAA